MILLASLPLLLTHGWPSLYRDCSVFPVLGEPQKRAAQHPPMALLCKPVPGAASTFASCSHDCSMHGGPTPNCSSALCTCTEHCMATDAVCTANIPHPDPTHHSLPDALAARPGRTVLLLNGERIAHGARFTPGGVHQITVVPGSNTTNFSWFLF